MSYTVKKGQPQGYPFYVTNKIREALIAEIYAINGYAEHIANSNMEDINATWRSIMDDEKKHYGWFLNLLRQYDPVQYKSYKDHIDDKLGPKDPMQKYKPDYTKQIILNNIRDDIKGELEAVILYEQHLAQISYQDIKDVFYAVASEEKEHAEHLTQLLLKYDPDQYDSLE
ncbi:ferritin family protein [Candidatus Formimonas warabiya]|uniref:ferritin family protein n=1 Tax=Formimonas warabiya TaxID=1761012 RepID=UPI0011D051F8|nr:ferritin family protein [Candidatus Formimonas warabiya]